MKMAMISIVMGALGTIIKDLVLELADLEIRGRVETMQTPALLRSVRILRNPWRLEEACCYSVSCEKPSGNACVKNSQKRCRLNNCKNILIGTLFSCWFFAANGLIDIGKICWNIQTFYFLSLYSSWLA